jgi:hypothetical protein
MLRAMKRVFYWRVTITVRPAFVLALVVADLAYRLTAPRLENALTRHSWILYVLNITTGVVLFLLVLLLAVCATTKPNRHRHR